jgi:hypothetical protein
MLKVKLYSLEKILSADTVVFIVANSQDRWRPNTTKRSRFFPFGTGSMRSASGASH